MWYIPLPGDLLQCSVTNPSNPLRSMSLNPTSFPTGNICGCFTADLTCPRFQESTARAQSVKKGPEAAGDRPITLWDSVTDASKATWQKRSEYSTGEQDMNPLLQEIFKHADYGYAF